MQKVSALYFEYSDNEFLVRIADENGERDVEVSAAEFLKFKQASPLGYIAVDVERNVPCSDGICSYNEYVSETRFATLEQYLDITEESDVEADLAVIIDRREGRTEAREIGDMADIFKPLQKTS